MRNGPPHAQGALVYRKASFVPMVKTCGRGKKTLLDQSG